MGKGVAWRGKYFIIPQAASRVDPSGLDRVALGPQNRVVLLGEATGLLVPKTPRKITNPSLGLDLVHPDNDEFRQAIKVVFDPAPGSEGGASEVYLMAINPATQSVLDVDTKLDFTSHLYGLIANKVRLKVETGTTSGTKKFSIQYGEEVEVYDNLGKKMFSIQYDNAEAGTAATMTIDGTQLTSTVTGDAPSDLALTFAQYPTIQDLVDAIEAVGTYIVTVSSGSSKVDLCTDLTQVTAEDIYTATYETDADLKAIEDAINLSSAFVSVARQTGANGQPANMDWTYMASAIDGATANSDWQDAYDVLKEADYDILVPLDSTESIHVMGDSHCAYMSGFEGKSERRQIVGGALQTWASEAGRVTAVGILEATAKVLNSDRTLHTGLGINLYNDDGVNTLYPPYVTAAMYAGRAAGFSVEEPLTNKTLRVLGLEVDLRRGEVQELLEAGIAVPMPDTVRGAGFVISRQVTTWLQNFNDYYVEWSVGRGADYIAREVRYRHDELIGRPGSEQFDRTMLTLTNAVLEAAKVAGIINEYDPTATQIRADGTVRYVDYSAEPILPINWIFSTYHLQPTVRTIQLNG